MAGPCTAGDEETECDCEAFAPRSSDPQTCRFCLHSEYHHAIDSSGSDEDTVQAILESSMAAVQGPTSKPRLPTKAKGGLMARQNTSMIFKKANAETAEGMRPKKAKKALKAKARAKPTAAEDLPVVSFRSVLMRVDGLDSNMDIVNNRVPDFSDIVEGSNMGIAHLGSKDIEFPVDATAEDVVAILRAHLPKVFAYFDELETTEIVDDDGVVTLAHWVLAMATRQRLKVVPLTEVTGRDLLNLVKSAKSRINDLTLATREPVPAAVVAKWSTRTALFFKKSSGSALDEEEDDLESFGDRPKRKRNSRLSKISDDETISEVEPKGKKAKRSQSTVKWSRKSLPNIFKDNVAAELRSDNNTGNAIAGPSHQPIDLTHSRSPTPLFFGGLTPPYRTAPLDPAYSKESETDPTIPNPYETCISFKF
ncbi:hypothetical protein C8R45DRAFT_1135639 [Mycena sanguinolenta]|nr:hypothetical protein C8R45DRAFT_1135639 [Mycena sanguinolenta]